MDEENKTEEAVEEIGKKAGQSALNKTKKAAKVAIKHIARLIGHAIVSIVTALLPYILVAIAVIALFSGIAYVLELFDAEDATNTVYQEFGLVDSKGDIANIVEIKSDSKGYHLEFNDDVEKKLDSVLEKMKKENSTIEVKDKETLKKFLIAEVKTKFPNLGGEEDDKTKFQGTINIKRITANKTMGEAKKADKKEVTLKYVDSGTFDGYVNNNDKKALDVFTLDDKKNIITATWSYKKETGKDAEVKIEKNSAMDYRTVTAKYTMPFEYPLFFLIDGAAEDFCSGLAELAMKSSLEIAVVDDVTNIKTTIKEYIKEEKKEVTTTTEEKEDGTKEEKKDEKTTVVDDGTKPKTETVIDQENVSTKIMLSQVDSWALKNKTTINMQSNETIGEEQSKTDAPVVTTTTDESENKKTETTTTKTKTTKTKIDEYNNKFDITKNEVEDNTEKFVELYKKYKDNLDTNILPDWLFEIMENNEKTKDLIELTKYLLYKATGKDYGVKDLNDIDLVDWSEDGDGEVVGKGFWWPIGSKETTVENGKTFASGSPEIPHGTHVVRGGRSKGWSTQDHLKTTGEALDISSAGAGDNHYNIISMAKGTVERANDGYPSTGPNDDNGGMGNCVYVRYPNNILVRYMHMYPGSITVKAGDTVDYGQVIGKMGNSGQSYGTHLHIDMWIGAENSSGGQDVAAYLDATDPRPSERRARSFTDDANVQLAHDYIAQWEFVTAYKYLYTNEYDNSYEKDFTIRMGITKDKKYFKCFEDYGLNNGTRNFGFGILHYQNGVYNNVALYAKYGVNIKEEKYKNVGTLLDVDIVEKVAMDIIANNRNYIIKTAKNAGVTFNDNQLNALTYLAHKAPAYIPRVVNAYKQYGDTETFANYCWNIYGVTQYKDWTSALWNVFHNGVYKTRLGETIDLSKYSSRGSGVEKGKEGSEYGYKKVYQSSSGKSYKLYIQGMYSHVPYWNGTVCNTGCGPTSAAIILSGFGRNDTPETVARSYAANGSWYGECLFFRNRGFKAEQGGIDWNKAISHLKQGNPMVVSINRAIYLNGHYYDGHYITFLDIDEKNNKIYIGDPNEAGNGWFKIDFLKNSGAFGQFFYVSK